MKTPSLTVLTDAIEQIHGPEVVAFLDRYSRTPGARAALGALGVTVSFDTRALGGDKVFAVSLLGGATPQAAIELEGEWHTVPAKDGFQKLAGLVEAMLEANGGAARAETISSLDSDVEA